MIKMNLEKASKVEVIHIWRVFGSVYSLLVALWSVRCKLLHFSTFYPSISVKPDSLLQYYRARLKDHQGFASLIHDRWKVLEIASLKACSQSIAHGPHRLAICGMQGYVAHCWRLPPDWHYRLQHIAFSSSIPSWFCSTTVMPKSL